MNVLAIDIGTTNVKASVVDERGRVLRVASRELSLHSPVPGSAEHSPDELLSAIRGASKEAAKSFSIEAVALSCYQHGLLVVDKDLRPLTHILTHMDCRSAPYVKLIEQACDPLDLYKRTGCPPLFVYALPKILWLKRERPHIAAQASRYLLVKDYVVAKALGDPYIDYGNASGSQLFNITAKRWDDLALQLAEVDEGQLAEPVEGAKVLCELNGRGAELFGVKAGTPLVLGTFDGAAQNLGLGVTEGYDAALNLGTTAVVRMLSREPVIDEKAMRLFCYYAAHGYWAFGGSTNNGGSVLRWLRDNFGWLEVTAGELLGEDPYDILCAEAERVPPGASGLVFLPFMAGERFPFRDPYLRGALLGLRYDHRKGHVIRAFMEGVAMTIRAIVDVLAEVEHKPCRLVGGGGGLKSKLWASIVSSATRLPVVRVKGGEHASNIGVAALALIALGAASSLERLTEWREVLDVVEPSRELVDAYEELYRRFTEAYAQLAPLFRSWAEEG
ncbi:MAG: gluconokinase [Thermofilaceae archaeon]